MEARLFLLPHLRLLIEVHLPTHLLVTEQSALFLRFNELFLIVDAGFELASSFLLILSFALFLPERFGQLEVRELRNVV